MRFYLYVSLALLCEIYCNTVVKKLSENALSALLEKLLKGTVRNDETKADAAKNSSIAIQESSKILENKLIAPFQIDNLANTESYVTSRKDTANSSMNLTKLPNFIAGLHSDNSEKTNQERFYTEYIIDEVYEEVETKTDNSLKSKHLEESISSTTEDSNFRRMLSEISNINKEIQNLKKDPKQTHIRAEIDGHRSLYIPQVHPISTHSLDIVQANRIQNPQANNIVINHMPAILTHGQNGALVGQTSGLVLHSFQPLIQRRKVVLYHNNNPKVIPSCSTCKPMITTFNHQIYPRIGI
ncbi:uncharacterized protein LOC126966872 [Leptidea sinapis]|uniref:uncharacterized protein LOC126966872 n=1 Tax=Leptidea sinapis TaxID=189913 RepID=UPI002133E576|nr:uncharacterized protein LOC126966872 [Leptidea sinapis]